MAGIRHHKGQPKGQPDGPLDARADLARAIAERDEARRKRVFDRLYFEQNSARRELSGLPPLPTPPGLEDTREDVLETLQHVIPHYRADRGWHSAEGREFLNAWEDSELEKLNELDQGGEA